MARTETDRPGDGSGPVTDLEESGPASSEPDATAAGRGGRETTEIVRTLVEDTQQLFEKHVELARQEMVEAVEARIVAAIAGATAAVAGLFALGFLAAAAAHALDLVMPSWASRLIVGGAFLVVVAIGAVLGRERMKRPPYPEATKKALKEDAEWARARLRR